ncbi:MAG: baseplate J/gp47 family protein [Planctomycetota bacterium]
MEGAQAHLLHGHIQYATRQVVPTTATDEWLDRHADLYSIARKLAAKASGAARFTGTDGSILPAGTLLQSASGVSFLVTASGTVGDPFAGSVTVGVEAIEGGAAGNIGGNVPINLASPVPGIASTGTTDIASPVTGGADRETDTALLGRLITRLSTPPQGGAKADYELWALEVPGVTRAWATPNQNGPGTVGLTFVTDDDPGGLIPDAAKVSEVAAYVDERRPVTVNELQVTAPTQSAVDLSIALNPNTTDVQLSVRANLEDLFVREAQPGKTLALSLLGEAIATASGEVYHVLSSPVANVVPAAGELLVLGEVTFSGLPNL